MATNDSNQPKLGRQLALQAVHYLRKTITFEDGSVSLGFVPSGALILKGASSANVTVAFNAGTTNTIDVGTGSDADAFASALAGGTIASVPFDEFAAGNVVADDTEIFAAYNTSGTAATAGSAVVVVAFIPDNDG